jgi:hypothetical protein
MVDADEIPPSKNLAREEKDEHYAVNDSIRRHLAPPDFPERRANECSIS